MGKRTRESVILTNSEKLVKEGKLTGSLEESKYIILQLVIFTGGGAEKNSNLVDLKNYMDKQSLDEVSNGILFNKLVCAR